MLGKVFVYLFSVLLVVYSVEECFVAIVVNYFVVAVWCWLLFGDVSWVLLGLVISILVVLVVAC